MSSTSGMKLGRLEVAVFHDKAPLAAENMVLSSQGGCGGHAARAGWVRRTPAGSCARRHTVASALCWGVSCWSGAWEQVSV